jgi:hypothetical protein
VRERERGRTRKSMWTSNRKMHTSAYVSIRPHTPAYVSIRPTPIGTGRVCGRAIGRCQGKVASIRQHTSAYASIRQHTSAYVPFL